MICSFELLFSVRSSLMISSRMIRVIPNCMEAIPTNSSPWVYSQIKYRRCCLELLLTVIACASRHPQAPAPSLKLYALHLGSTHSWDNVAATLGNLVGPDLIRMSDRKSFLDSMSGGAWRFLVGGAICRIIWAMVYISAYHLYIYTYIHTLVPFPPRRHSYTH